MTEEREISVLIEKDECKDAAGKTQPWRRVLWARQPYPDNYVPANFLGELRTKPLNALPDLSTLMLWSLPLSQHLSIILVFVALFLHLRGGLLGSEVLASCSALVIIGCGATMPGSSVQDDEETLNGAGARNAGPKANHQRAMAQPLSYALLALVILALSPLLKTLTEATTSDSITALSTTLFMLSFALADFSEARAAHLAPGAVSEDGASTKPPLPATLSLNAALCASIVLASRLRSPVDVFSLVLAAIGLFAFLPRWLRHHLARLGTGSRRRWQIAVGLTLAMLVVSAASLARFSPTAAWTNVATAVFLNVVCPAWMKKAQGWKQARRGPWDIGVPRLRSR